MKIAISNIAWKSEEEVKAASLMQRLGIKGVEIAPAKVFANPASVTKGEVLTYRRFWEERGIEIIAMQALLFGKAELTIFESASKRENTFRYLKKIIELGGLLGAKALVFGSPKNRKIGDFSSKKIDPIAVAFFGKLGDAALKNKTKFCIEPNPPEYGCDYITTPQEGLKLVKAVNSKGFGLHLDAGGLILSKQPAKSILGYKNYICHFHVSNPFLACLPEEYVSRHREFAYCLMKIGYGGWASIEMRPVNLSDNIMAIEKALIFAKSVYC